jgi:hypothetical protein
MRSAGCLSLLFWLDDRLVPEASSSELYCATQARRLMDRVVLGRAHPYFYMPFGFRGGASTLCWLLISWSMLSCFIVLTVNVIEGEICGQPMVV